MKYLQEYRDPERAESLLKRIRQTAQRRWVIMEVCGGQTHSLLKYGLDTALEEVVELLHGPGCPVCVTPPSVIDHAQEIAQRPGTVLCSFGDMLRVPGSNSTMLQAKARGGQVQIVYSPLDAIELAGRHPQKEVVFLGVGFETTAPATALAVLQAQARGLTNFSLLAHHVRVQPAMEAILQEPACRVQAFLAAGHVCTVMGYDCYSELVTKYHVPVVVTGFEPVDLLTGILQCVEQLEAGRTRVANAYARNVCAPGNLRAQALIEQVYEVFEQEWRGLGQIPESGYRLRETWAAWDAHKRYPRIKIQACEAGQCRAGDVLAGRIKPTDCAAFGKGCTPETPLGAPMVSSEGACAAYYRYRLPLVESAA